MSANEKVLCVSVKTLDSFLKVQRILRPRKLHEAGLPFPGNPNFFSSLEVTLEYICNIFNYTNERVPVIMPRSECEEDTRFRQLASYSVINFNGDVLVYRRGKPGAEKRLHDLNSIGIGGHINDSDINGPLTVDSLIRAVNRETYEEINVNPSFNSRYVGVVCVLEPQSSVDAVHVGIVFEYFVTDSHIKGLEDCIADPRFVKCSAIRKDSRNGAYYDSLESWSKVLAESMIEPYDLPGFGRSVFPDVTDENKHF